MSRNAVIGVHLAREHALKLKRRQLFFQFLEIAGHGGGDLGVAFLARQFQQFA